MNFSDFSSQTFVAVVCEELNCQNSDFLRQLFDDLDVERSGYISIHQLLAVTNFSRLHRGSTIDDIIRAIFDGVIWEAAILEQNNPAPKKGKNVGHTTYIGSRALISFDIYKKHSKKKELMDSVLRLFE